MRFVLLVIAVLTIGCTAPLSKAPSAPASPPFMTATLAKQSAPECISLDSQHRTWGGIAKFSGVLAGAGGLTTVPIDDDHKGLRLGIGITSLLIGGIAAAAVYIEQDAATSYARDCN